MHRIEVTMIALLPAALSLYAVAAVPTITPAEAARHVGQEVVVQGTVSQIATTVNLTTHINFGGLYPNHVFTATIFKAKQSLFTGVRQRFEGKVARVQGTVRLYRGKPEIVINEPGQLRLVEGGTPSSAGPGAVTGPELEDPRFDPRGADFADWVAAFKVTVGQQWRVLEHDAAGKVDLEFVVERDGSMSAMRVVESSGSLSLDRAAASALGTSRFLPLPEAYPSQSVMMRVSLVHGGGMK
jgi:TonB family protein